ncbi:FAD-dependent oxidoreductase, partial [Mycobacterium stomatepiae]
MTTAVGQDRTVTTVIIGAGLAGLGAAIRLLDAGIEDIVVLERASEVGGTWRDNTYPGVACDVPSLMYSYSFEPNPRWSQTYAS